MARKHGGHHGGAWKVAYADFTTAMMALFLLLWLISQDQKIKEAIQRTFRTPLVSVTKETTGIIPSVSNSGNAESTKPGPFDSASSMELSMLKRLNQSLHKTLEVEKDPENQTVKLELTPEGLRINIFDRSRKPIFEPDSAQLTEYGNWVLSTVAWEISRYTAFRIELEGHTQRGRIPKSLDYGNWELSADRANAARRKLLLHGVQGYQIRKVAGFADTQPMRGVAPNDEANRRVTILLKLSLSETA